MGNIKFNFQNKNVLVIGGSRGIGGGVVLKFLEAGANVSYASKTSMGVNNKKLQHHECDIEDYSDINNLFKNFKKLDILVNVAAINFCKKINEISLSEWNKVINTNLTSYFLIIQHALNIMSRGSKIVNVSSIAGRSKSLVSGTHYVSSKSGMIGLTRQIAFEVGEKGINVNCVCPSQTITDMLKKSMTDTELKELSKSIPIKRLANIEDQVNPILFLCSEESSYIHGAILDVNGGQL